MAYFKFIIFLTSIIIPGSCLFLLAYKRKLPLFFLLALGFGVGVFLQSIQIFLIVFIFRLKIYTIFLFSLIAIESIILLFLAFRYSVNMIVWPGVLKFKNITAQKIILALFIIIILTFSFVSAASKPVATYDSIAFWAYKAKTLYFEKSISFDKNDPLYLGGLFHKNYPWLIPITQSWMHWVLGNYDEMLINYIFYLFYIATLVVVYYLIKECAGVTQGLFFILYLASIPLYFIHSFNVYADLPLAFFVLCGWYFFSEWEKSGYNRDMFFSAMFFSIGCWTKSEGIIFILAALLTFLIVKLMRKFRKDEYPANNAKIRKIIIYLGLIVAFCFFRFFYLQLNGLGLSNVPPGIGFHPQVFKSVLANFFVLDNWNIWWYFFILVFLIRFKEIIRNVELLAGWVYIFLSLSGFYFLFLFTNLYIHAENYSAPSRNILLIIPISIVVASCTLFKGKKDVC